MKTMKFLVMLLAPLAALLAPAALTADEEPEFITETLNPETGLIEVRYTWDQPATVYSINNQLQPGKTFYPHTQIGIINPGGRSKGKIYTVLGGELRDYNLKSAQQLNKGDLLYSYRLITVTHDSEIPGTAESRVGSWGELFRGLWQSTGLYDLWHETNADFANTWLLGLGKLLMMCVALVLLYLAIIKGFEPLLLLPIGFGALLSNIPIIGISTPGGLLYLTYNVGIESGFSRC